MEFIMDKNGTRYLIFSSFRNYSVFALLRDAVFGVTPVPCLFWQNLPRNRGLLADIFVKAELIEKYFL